MDELLGILRCCVNLRSLKLFACGFEGGKQELAEAAIYLLGLKSLTLTLDETEMGHILTIIQTPNCTSYQLIASNCMSTSSFLQSYILSGQFFNLVRTFLFASSKMDIKLSVDGGWNVYIVSYNSEEDRKAGAAVMKVGKGGFNVTAATTSLWTSSDPLQASYRFPSISAG
ncbi:hypothetical protein FRB96_003572 [Tulasnella sp. 330]|nr:hypothetical protein FRB96_003572 [Tulasnella sp. 330]KAG8886249.1 hypothetical protein FRB97_006253 [Tulasnella sp. 331]